MGSGFTVFIFFNVGLPDHHITQHTWCNQEFATLHIPEKHTYAVTLTCISLLLQSAFRVYGWPAGAPIDKVRFQPQNMKKLAGLDSIDIYL